MWWYGTFPYWSQRFCQGQACTEHKEHSGGLRTSTDEHNGSHYCCHFGGRQMYGMWWHSYEIRNTKIIRSLCFNRGVRKNNGPCPLHDNTRLHTAETIKSNFTDYKWKATPLPTYSPGFQLFPKLQELLCGQGVQSLGTLNAAVTRRVRQLTQIGN